MSQYSQDSSEDMTLIDKDEKVSFLTRERQPRTQKSDKAWRRSWLLLACNSVLLVCSILILSVTVFLHHDSTCEPEHQGRNLLLKKTSHFSPILDQVDIPLKEVHIDGSFFESNNDSLFRQLPSPEVDAAWDRITIVGQVFLTTEEVIKLGKDPTMTVRNNNNRDQHIGLINVFHEIHCLNVIRQNLHRDYYYPEGIQSPYHWIHLYHCLNVVLQALQCSANVDIVTYNYQELMPGPVFDFSINRVCRDFDALWEWQNRTLKPIESYRFHREGWEPQILAPEQLKKIKEHGTKPWPWSKEDPAVLGSIESWY